MGAAGDPRLTTWPRATVGPHPRSLVRLEGLPCTLPPSLWGTQSPSPRTCTPPRPVRTRAHSRLRHSGTHNGHARHRRGHTATSLCTPAATRTTSHCPSRSHSTHGTRAQTFRTRCGAPLGQACLRGQASGQRMGTQAHAGRRGQRGRARSHLVPALSSWGGCWSLRSLTCTWEQPAQPGPRPSVKRLRRIARHREDPAFVCFNQNFPVASWPCSHILC